MRSLLVTVALLIAAPFATSEDPPPSKSGEPGVKADKRGVLLIKYGSSAVFELKEPKDGIPPTDIHNTHDAVVGVRLDPNNSRRIFLTGRALGSATVTFLYKDGSVEKYLVVVEAPRPEVAKRLRPGYLAFAIRLAPEDVVAGIVGLNDHVNVYSARTGAAGKKGTLLMKNIRVLCEPVAFERPVTHYYVLLEVTNEEAKLLKGALEGGSISLALVAEADTQDEKSLQDRKGDELKENAAPPKKDLQKKHD